MLFHFLTQMDGPSTGVNVEYLINGLEDKIVQAYYAYMVNTAVIFGADRKRAERELNDTLNFEIALAKVSFTDSYLDSLN